MLIVRTPEAESSENPVTPATNVVPILSINPEVFTVITGINVADPYVPESTVAAPWDQNGHPP